MSKYYDKLIRINEALENELKSNVFTEDGNSENTIEISRDSLTPDQKKEVLLNKGVDQKAVDNLKDDKALDGALDATLNNNEVKNESSPGTNLSMMDWEGPAIIVHQDVDCANEYYVEDEVWSTDIKRATEFENKEAAKAKIEELCERDGLTDDSMFIWSAKSKLDESDGVVKVEDNIDESVIIRIDDDDLDIHGYVKKFENGKVEWTDDEQEAEKFQHEELGQSMIEAICTKFHYDPSTFTIKSVDPRADEPYEDDEEGQNWVSLDPMHPGAATLP